MTADYQTKTLLWSASWKDGSETHVFYVVFQRESGSQEEKNKILKTKHWKSKWTGFLLEAIQSAIWRMI